MTAVCPLCGAKPWSTMVDHSLRLVSRCPNLKCRVIKWWTLNGTDVAELMPAPASGWVTDEAGEHRCPDCASAVTP